MNTVHFERRGKSYSYGDFYRGFGLSCTVSMLRSAFLDWHLGQLARSTPTAVGVTGWASFFLQLPGVVLSFLYFGPPHGAFGTRRASSWLRGLAGGKIKRFIAPPQVVRSATNSCFANIKERCVPLAKQGSQATGFLQSRLVTTAK